MQKTSIPKYKHFSAFLSTSFIYFFKLSFTFEYITLFLFLGFWSPMSGPGYIQQSTHIWLNTGEINQCHDDKIQLLSQSGITKMFSKATGKIRAGQSGNQWSPCGTGELMWGVRESGWDGRAQQQQVYYDSLENTEVSCLNSQASSCLILLIMFHTFLFSPIPHPSQPWTLTISITSYFLYKISF